MLPFLKEYTPKRFTASLGINTSDYVEITSYTHHPFYSRFILEVPDNWIDGQYYNVPLDDLLKIMDKALANGFTVAWDGDDSRDNFYRNEGYVVVLSITIIQQRDRKKKKMSHKK